MHKHQKFRAIVQQVTCRMRKPKQNPSNLHFHVFEAWARCNCKSCKRLLGRHGRLASMVVNPLLDDLRRSLRSLFGVDFCVYRHVVRHLSKVHSCAIAPHARILALCLVPRIQVPICGIVGIFREVFASFSLFPFKLLRSDAHGFFDRCPADHSLMHLPGLEVVDQVGKPCAPERTPL